MGYQWSDMTICPSSYHYLNGTALDAGNIHVNKTDKILAPKELFSILRGEKKYIVKILINIVSDGYKDN